MFWNAFKKLKSYTVSYWSEKRFKGFLIAVKNFKNFDILMTKIIFIEHAAGSILWCGRSQPNLKW